MIVDLRIKEKLQRKENIEKNVDLFARKSNPIHSRKLILKGALAFLELLSLFQVPFYVMTGLRPSKPIVAFHIFG